MVGRLPDPASWFLRAAPCVWIVAGFACIVGILVVDWSPGVGIVILHFAAPFAGGGCIASGLVDLRKRKIAKWRDQVLGLLPKTITLASSDESGDVVLVERNNGELISLPCPADYHPKQDGARFLMESLLPRNLYLSLFEDEDDPNPKEIEP